MCCVGCGVEFVIDAIEHVDTVYKKYVNTTDFFKTRIENSHEKSTLGLKRAKVLFSCEFSTRVLKKNSCVNGFFYKMHLHIH